MVGPAVAWPAMATVVSLDWFQKSKSVCQLEGLGKHLGLFTALDDQKLTVYKNKTAASSTENQAESQGRLQHKRRI